MQSKAGTVEQYLAEVPEDRRATMEAVMKTIRANLDRSIEEGMQYGMIGWYIPHSVFPNGYHCDPSQPLPFAALASQKNHLSLYMMFAYMDGEAERQVRDGLANAGKKVDLGKSCLRFRKLEDIDLDVIGAVFKQATVQKYIDQYVARAGPDAWKGKKKASNATTRS